MVHLKLALVLAAAAANLCVAEDRSCKNHRLYCGHTLTSGMGWSLVGIQQSVAASDWNAGHVPNHNQIPESLFKCGASGGSLVWVNNQSPCANCVDGGAGQSDYCS